jgi:alpha-glucosidase (family GH31 glycosyl hydrolase)
MPNAARRDCGYWDANSCQQNNCCWTPVQSLATAHLTEAQLANPPMHMLEAGTPWCYTPQSLVGGYVVTSAAALRPSASQRPGWAMQLKLADGDGYFGPDAPQLIVRVVFETKQRLRVHISDPTEARWEIPESLLPLAPGDASVMKMEDTHYAFSYTNSPFGFAVTRRDDGEVLFNTTSPVGPDGQTPLFSGLVFSDQFLSLSTSLPANPVVYGLGEKVTSLQLQTSGKPVTFWARDAATPVDQNIYGSHPFYMEHRRTVTTEHERANGIKSTFTTKTHGVWLRNSNGMDVLIHDAQSAVRKWQENNPSRQLSDAEAASYNKGYLTYRVIGGVLDFFIYAGSTATSTSTAAAIVQQYQVSVGLPHMPPYWSLGFHQCRWGYANLQEVKDMVTGYSNTDLPLDTAWTDIDYMVSWFHEPHQLSV